MTNPTLCTAWDAVTCGAAQQPPVAKCACECHHSPWKCGSSSAHPTPPAPLDGARIAELLKADAEYDRERASVCWQNEGLYCDGHHAKAAKEHEERAALYESLAAALPGLLDRQRDARDAERYRALREWNDAEQQTEKGFVLVDDYVLTNEQLDEFADRLRAARTPSPEAPR